MIDVDAVPALETVDVTVRYGGVTANDHVSVRVPAGKIVGLIGPNGAGKTSLIDAITGFAPSSGDVLVSGRSIRSLPPHRRARAGVTRTWQALDLFPDLTVSENVEVAARRATGPRRARRPGSPRRAEVRVDALLAQLGLSNGDVMPEELPLGTRKLVSLARALASEPQVVLLDEPAAGLDSVGCRLLSEGIRNASRTGAAVLLVDHNLDLVLDLCQQLYVLDAGRVIASGSPDELRRDPRVVDSYLGSAGETAARSIP